ncbi:hypothetical protein LSA_05560 [Fructilactobacillus sanfranciscensis TMW 1.1304]|uniref:ACT domain-containing protein n=2 Tax=Fructilactobacillus sanfranciscensis TaxID=1625 RepID=G2KVH8_FRUST|nr:hypothetical protein LSA_05560 [Fructilactobacillus sanfranciscensis TMW 1.1304]
MTIAKKYIVNKELLPTILPKVVKAYKLLDSGKAKSISNAAKQIGISRDVIYKYRGLISDYDDSELSKKVIFSVRINDQYGVMSKILTVISKNDASVITINMTLPIHKEAVINFTIDTHQLRESLHEMLDEINELPEIISVNLISAE